MAAMCPIDGCRKKKGLCLHDKMMIAMGAMGILFIVGRWGLHLI